MNYWKINLILEGKEVEIKGKIKERPSCFMQKNFSKNENCWKSKDVTWKKLIFHDVKNINEISNINKKFILDISFSNHVNIVKELWNCECSELIIKEDKIYITIENCKYKYLK